MFPPFLNNPLFSKQKKLGLVKNGEEKFQKWTYLEQEKGKERFLLILKSICTVFCTLGIGLIFSKKLRVNILGKQKKEYYFPVNPLLNTSKTKKDSFSVNQTDSTQNTPPYKSSKKRKASYLPSSPQKNNTSTKESSNISNSPNEETPLTKQDSNTPSFSNTGATFSIGNQQPCSMIPAEERLEQLIEILCEESQETDQSKWNKPFTSYSMEKLVRNSKYLKKLFNSPKVSDDEKKLLEKSFQLYINDSYSNPFASTTYWFSDPDLCKYMEFLMLLHNKSFYGTQSISEKELSEDKDYPSKCLSRLFNAQKYFIGKIKPIKNAHLFPLIFHPGGNHWTVAFADTKKNTLTYYDSKYHYGKFRLIESSLKRCAKKHHLKYEAKLKQSIQPDSHECGTWVGYFTQQLLENPEFDPNQIPPNERAPLIKNFRAELIGSIIVCMFLERIHNPFPCSAEHLLTEMYVKKWTEKSEK